MLRLLPADAVAPQWKTWDIAPAATIELLIGRPTLADQFAIIDAIRKDRDVGYELGEIQARIKDWRGVQDEQGQPLPYSLAALDRIIATYPESFWTLLRLVRETSVGMSETDEKNCVVPPSAGGTAMTTATIDTTG